MALVLVGVVCQVNVVVVEIVVVVVVVIVVVAVDGGMVATWCWANDDEWK